MPTLTCHHAGERAADRHRREGAGGAAKGRHDGRGAAERRERGAHAVAAVAAVVHLGGGGVAHVGGVGPVVAHVGISRPRHVVVRSVLEGRALVLFALDATHPRA